MREKYLKHKEAADYLQISPGTLYNWVNRKMIEVVKLHGTLRYRLSSLEKYMNDRTQIVQKAR